MPTTHIPKQTPRGAHRRAHKQIPEHAGEGCATEVALENGWEHGCSGHRIGSTEEDGVTRNAPCSTTRWPSTSTLSAAFISNSRSTFCAMMFFTVSVHLDSDKPFLPSSIGACTLRERGGGGREATEHGVRQQRVREETGEP
jgi:hypothetical protein